MATGSTQRRLARAPHTIRTATNGSRTHTGMGR